MEVFSGLGANVVACDVEGADLPKDRRRTHYFDLLDDLALDDGYKRMLVNGPPAAVVLNAGWTRAETLEDVTAEVLAAEMDLNFKSAALLSKTLIPAMRKRPSGASFVFISSVDANAHFGNPAYAAAKAPLHAWMPPKAIYPVDKEGVMLQALGNRVLWTFH